MLNSRQGFINDAVAEPDPLHKMTEQSLKNCLEKFAQSDLPNLWKPRADQFYHVDEFAYLGTGKLDLRRLRELAQERSNAGPELASAAAPGSSTSFATKTRPSSC